MSIYKFEIFEKSNPGKTLETVEFDDFRSFRTYWKAQCNWEEFGYRQIQPVPEPHQWMVLKLAAEPRFPETVKERIPLSDELCDKISRFNGGLTPGEVHAALVGGRVIYTSFSRYTIEG